MITSLGLKAKTRPKKYKKARYAIVNVSNKDLSKIIREFDKISNRSYESRRPKHEPNDSYFYPARQLAKCMMRYDALNLHVYPIRTEITATKQIPTLQVCSTDNSELKEFLVDKTLSQICSTEKDDSKGIIIKECSTEEDKSQCIYENINKQKTQRMRQSMRNLQLQMKCRAILTYSNVIGFF